MPANRTEGKAGVRTACDPAPTGGRLRDAFLQLVFAMRAGESTQAPLARLAEAAAGSDLEPVLAELGGRLAGADPAVAYRWLMLAPPSADLYHEEAAHRFALIAATAAREGGQVACWGWSWVAEGCVTAYEATRQRRFAQLVVDRFLDLLDYRDDRTGRVDVLRGGPQPTWGVPVEWWQDHKRGGFAGGWTTLVDMAGRVTYPLLRLARLLAAEGRPLDASVRTAGIVGECARSLAVFDADFEEHAATGAGYYRRRSDGKVEPLNHSLAAGRALVELAALTGDRDAAGRVEGLVRGFRWALRVDRRRAFVWPYQPVPGEPLPRRSSQVWKADVDTAFALACHEHGRGFTDGDLGRFARTFTRNVVLPSGDLNARISRDDAEPLALARSRGTARLRAPGIVTWNQFGRWAPAIDRRLAEEVAVNTELFPRGWFTSARTGRAYAQRLLGRPGSPWYRVGRRVRIDLPGRRAREGPALNGARGRGRP